MEYPQFRKYIDGNTFFKIENPISFYELKRMGKYYSFTFIDCKIYPERMFLNDLINRSFESIEIINEDEFQFHLTTWKRELILFENEL